MRWDDILNAFIELVKQNPRVKDARKLILALPPSIFYAIPQSQLNIPYKEEFLTQTFENLKSLNYYFEIHSDWARGNKEMLMVSIKIINQHEIEETVFRLCKKFSERMQYTLDNSEIKERVQDLYWEILEDTRKKKEEEEKISFLKNNPILLLEFVENKILIIDNELDNEFLKLGYFETITCSNVNEALKLIEDRNNDLAIIFQNSITPGLNIYEFLHSIKSDERYKFISVIMRWDIILNVPSGDLGLMAEPHAKRPAPYITKKYPSNDLKKRLEKIRKKEEKPEKRSKLIRRRIKKVFTTAIDDRNGGPMDTSKEDIEDLQIARDPQVKRPIATVIVIEGETIRKDDGGELPYPYVFKSPTPPGDLGLVGEPQAKEPITNQVLVYETYCKYCGAELPKGQTICHVCGKKVI